MAEPDRSVTPPPERKRPNGEDGGLSEREARARLAQYGYNEIEEKRDNPLLGFLSHFWGPISWMIEVAAVLSAVVRDWTDFVVILALLATNALVAFWEEHQAANTVSALKAHLASKARVLRGGRWSTLPSRELVPGDRVRIRLGDIVPADVKLLEGADVQADQSALTGESMPAACAAGDTIYSGSLLVRGEMDAVVEATGRSTYMGKTVGLVETSRKESHFEKAVLKIGDYLILLALGLVVLIFAVALFRGDPVFTTLQFVLVLTVAAIPVAMPTILSVTMAVGARLMAARQAVVTRLASVEEMAGMDVLCSDKTGTLTMNELKPGEMVTAEGVDADDVILFASLASREEDQDAIDTAVIGGLADRSLLDRFEIVRFQPFDPVRKRTEAEVRGPAGESFLVSKGAPQVILDLVDADSRLRRDMEDAIGRFASRGFRSLAVARTDPGGAWRYQGLLSLYDPPRADSRETIEAARRLGVSIKMLTGDQTAIGKEIASQLGLGTNILDAEILEKGGHFEAGRIADTIEAASGFAQVYPEHKHHVIDVLQKRGHIVGMTGDGVNDAPALKKADAGIAVSGATDAARAAADMVLLSPGLSVIVDAIRLSRRIFSRMNSYAIYRITETIRVLLFMTLSILVFNFYPVTAVMIVLLALLNDGAILAIAYDRVRESDSPARWDMHKVLSVSTILGGVGLVATFGLFYLAENVFHLDREMIQTLIYLKLSVAGHLTIFATRTVGPFWSHRPSKLLVGAVFGTQLVATLIAVYGLFMTPLGWTAAVLVWGYSLVWFLLEDRAKLLAYRILDRDRPGLLARA